MKQFSYQIIDEQGIHARPAGIVVAEAKKYTCNINISKEDKKVDCKRIFGVMSLAAKKGDVVTFTFDGIDENEASSAVEKVVKENL